MVWFLDPSAPRSGQQAAIGADLIGLMDGLDIPRAILAGRFRMACVSGQANSCVRAHVCVVRRHLTLCSVSAKSLPLRTERGSRWSVSAIDNLADHLRLDAGEPVYQIAPVPRDRRALAFILQSSRWPGPQPVHTLRSQRRLPRCDSDTSLLRFIPQHVHAAPLPTPRLTGWPPPGRRSGEARRRGHPSPRR